MSGESSAGTAVNPYAAPRSRVEDPGAVTPGRPAFFPVSLLKLSLMSLATSGLYDIYWFYKNWKCMQERGEKVNAPIRAFFFPLFSYALFRRVREQARATGVDVSLPAGPLDERLAPGVDPNVGFGAWNIAALVVGALFFVLVMAGLLISPR